MVICMHKKLRLFCLVMRRERKSENKKKMSGRQINKRLRTWMLTTPCKGRILR